MNQRSWTIIEDEYIKNNFGKISITEMARHLNCAITTVQNRAILLGFTVEKKTVKRWTEEEIELLKIMSSKYLNKTIAKKLDRSVNEVNKKARQLGIDLIYKRPIWKKWKIKFLKENINKLSLAEIMRELDVNYNQIIDKITELNLVYDNKRWSEEEENLLIELSPTCYIREIAKVLNRTEKAIIKKARNMGLEYITLKHNYTEEELNYIKDNWGIISVTDMARKLSISRMMIQAQADKMNLPKLGNNPYRKWTEEEIEKLEKLSSKKSISELAKIFNTTNQAITDIARRNGIYLNDDKIHWTDEDNELLKEYAKTMDLEEIAIKMDRTTSAVRLQAKRQGISIQKNKKHQENIWTEEHSKQLTELVSEGKTLIEIVKKINKKDNTILKKAKELGLKIEKEERREWTELDIQKLTELAKTKKLSELVNELERTSSSIKEKAKTLGITIINDRKNWTEEEYQQLEKMVMIDKKTPKEIAEKLGRTEDSIIIKINRRGLKIQTNDKRYWTKDEEEKLMDLWGSEPIELIAKKLNRTASSVKNKVFQLGLGSAMDNNYMGLKIKEISELLGVNINTVSVSWISLGLKYKVQKISKSRSYKYVEIKDLYEFLEANQNIWDSRNLEKNILGIEPEWLKEKRKLDQKQNSGCEKLNLTKQQLILAKKFFLGIQE